MTLRRLTVTTLRLAVPLYLVSLALGAVGTGLGLIGLAGVAGDRPWLPRLLGDDWLNTLIEVGLSAFAGSEADRTAVGMLALAGVVATPLLVVLQWLGYTFLAGGILETILASRSPSAARGRFWAGCRRWFWPFARLGVAGMLAVLVLAVLGAVACALLSLAVGMSAAALVLAAWVALLVGWLELARAAMVWHQDQSVWSAFDHASRAAVRPTSLLLWLLLALPALGLLALTLSAPGGEDPSGTLTSVLGGQVVAFLWAWWKVIRLAAAGRLVASHQPSERTG